LLIENVINPPHKRAEGRAPAWGSEFTTQIATPQGGSAEIAAALFVQFWVLLTARGWWWQVKPFMILGLWNSLA